MLLFYDVDLFGEKPKSKPLTDEQYRQRCETYDALVADYKARAYKAFGSRQARKIEKEVAEFKDRNAMLDLDFDSWKIMLETILRTSCAAFIRAKIKCTPSKYQHEWTAEELDKLIGICGIEEQGRYYIFRTAGLACKVPECLAIYGFEDVVPKESAASVHA